MGRWSPLERDLKDGVLFACGCNGASSSKDPHKPYEGALQDPLGLGGPLSIMHKGQLGALLGAYSPLSLGSIELQDSESQLFNKVCERLHVHLCIYGYIHICIYI